jgi:nucleoside permease NupC
MAAPGALAVSKTIVPETKKTKADWDKIKSTTDLDAKSIFEAISIGASNMVYYILNLSLFLFVSNILINLGWSNRRNNKQFDCIYSIFCVFRFSFYLVF